LIWLAAKIANDKFNPTIYKYVCGASLYAYVSHYFFILILSVMIVRPYKIGFIPAFCIMMFGTLFLIFITYFPLNFMYELIVPEKETKKLDAESHIDPKDLEEMMNAQLKQEQE
jgi:hypothetical protein